MRKADLAVRETIRQAVAGYDTDLHAVLCATAAAADLACALLRRYRDAAPDEMVFDRIHVYLNGERHHDAETRNIYDKDLQGGER